MLTAINATTTQNSGSMPTENIMYNTMPMPIITAHMSGYKQIRIAGIATKITIITMADIKSTVSPSMVVPVAQ